MESEDKFVERLAKRHSLSPAAVQVVLVALRRGGGRMAQFSHADFGGMSQWSPGMSMVGDMFNTQLKSRLDALCTDIVSHLTASEVVGSDVSSRPEEVSYRSEATSPAWWPNGLGHPAAVGGQNDLRYAIFSESRRLVIDDRGKISTYDTGDHQIFGVAQAQSSERTLSFTSQSGLVKVTDLTKVRTARRAFSAESFFQPHTDLPSGASEAELFILINGSNGGRQARLAVWHHSASAASGAKGALGILKHVGYVPKNGPMHCSNQGATHFAGNAMTCIAATFSRAIPVLTAVFLLRAFQHLTLARGQPSGHRNSPLEIVVFLARNEAKVFQRRQ